jgi:hypothetical protein
MGVCTVASCGNPGGCGTGTTCCGQQCCTATEACCPYVGIASTQHYVCVSSDGGVPAACPLPCTGICPG